jgi:hypothetical protein
MEDQEKNYTPENYQVQYDQKYVSSFAVIG